MDISKIRLANLQAVLRDDFGGVKAHLAAAIGVSANNISRYFSDNLEHRRTLSGATARKIERATGRPDGWMDSMHEGEARPEIGALMAEIDGFSRSEFAELLAQIDLIKRRKRGDL